MAGTSPAMALALGVLAGIGFVGASLLALLGGKVSSGGRSYAIAVAVAAGILLAVAFGDLFPEALEAGEEGAILGFLGGFALLFLVQAYTRPTRITPPRSVSVSTRSRRSCWGSRSTTRRRFRPGRERSGVGCLRGGRQPRRPRPPDAGRDLARRRARCGACAPALTDVDRGFAGARDPARGRGHRDRARSERPTAQRVDRGRWGRARLHGCHPPAARGPQRGLAGADGDHVRGDPGRDMDRARKRPGRVGVSCRALHTRSRPVGLVQPFAEQAWARIRRPTNKADVRPSTQGIPLRRGKEWTTVSTIR